MERLWCNPLYRVFVFILFFICFNFSLVAATIFLISADILVEGFVLDVCCIGCWVLVSMDILDRL